MVYRYDFPSIDTYTSFVGENSLTNIVNNTFAFTQVVDVISYTKITGDVVVAGDLDCNTITTNSLEVKANINLYKVTYFDTIVLRRLDETDTALINFNELQCWVNGVNILVEYSELLTSYFANWTNKNIALASRENAPVSNIYNNIIEADLEHIVY